MSQIQAPFREALSQYDELAVVQRFITLGDCKKVTNPQYADLRSEVAGQFSVHPTDVYIVGSAKLGFSIAPHKRWQGFHDGSDIDVAIVSSKLYLEIWRQVSALISADKTFSWAKQELFSSKHLTGWLRPDALPPSKALPLADEWFEFFRALSARRVCGPYNINAGIYYDMHFLETYQKLAVAQCKIEQELQ